METKDILKQLRESKGYTIQDVSKRIGMSYTMCREYETGDRNLGMSAAIKFADFYNVSIDYLLGRQNKNSLSNSTDQINNKTKMKEQEHLALEKWLSLDEKKRKVVLNIIETILKELEEYKEESQNVQAINPRFNQQNIQNIKEELPPPIYHQCTILDSNCKPKIIYLTDEQFKDLINSPDLPSDL